MHKTYTSKFPGPSEIVWDVNRAILGLYNCHAYLLRQGFQELTKTTDPLGTLHGIRGEFIFPDGSHLSHKSFQQAEHKEKVLEKMVAEGVEFIRPGFFAYDSHDRERIIRTTISTPETEGYSFCLSLLDITKETTFFPLQLFAYTPKRFAVSYTITLKKEVITDQDTIAFAKYIKGIRDCLKLSLPIKAIPMKKRKRGKQTSTECIQFNIDELLIKVPEDYTPEQRIVDQRYQLEKLLGVGATSYVYQALDLEAGEQSPYQRVVIKISQGEEHRLRRSAKNVSPLLGLHKPNIAKIINISHRTEKEPYVVMELEDGITLQQLLDSYHRIDLPVVLNIIKQVAQGLQDTETIMPHLDLKPSNILLTTPGIVKLIDFGLKEYAYEDTLNTLCTQQTPDIKEQGTLIYMAPESHERQGDTKSDIYSLGVLLYHTLTGYLPQSSDAIHDIRDDIPPDIDQLFNDLYKRNPNDRLDIKGLLARVDHIQQKYSLIHPVSFSLTIKERKIIEEHEEERNILQASQDTTTPAKDLTLQRISLEEYVKQIRERKATQVRQLYTHQTQEKKAELE